MALSEDQKAMLRLLTERGERGYEDLAALTGVGVEEVHARALAAAAQLESEGIPAPAIPPPPGGVEAASPPPAAPEPVKPAPEPATQSEEPAKPAAPSPEPRRRPRLALPGGGARVALAAGALVVVALVVILLVGGSDSGSSAGGGAAEEAASANTGGEAKEVTKAVLAPVGGSGARGVAIFGRVKNSLALQLQASGLKPTGQGESYTVWLYESPQKMLPLASTRVGRSGKIAAQVEVPTEILGYLANETFGQIDISLTRDAALKASLAKATNEKKAPIYTGTDVLRGPITGPIIGAAKR
jgi:hypothetical protein